MADDARGQLIVLAAPILDDPYYASEVDAIIEFHIAFANRIAAPDRVLVLAGADTADIYADALGPDRVVTAAMEDIWTRDFGIMDPASSVMTRYTAAGQGGGRKGQRDADAVQETHAAFLEGKGIIPVASDLLNDGGNWVFDGAGNAVVSTKFLADNNLTEDEARAALREVTGARHIAFIEADEQGGLEHADGVVSFVGDGVLLVNSYADDPAYEKQLLADLRRGLPGVDIHTIVNAYDGSDIYDSRFGSACGLYTNALVTHHAVYLPQFGIPQDVQALETVRRLTQKQVIPVASQQVCHMGGGVRCMSSQIDLVPSKTSRARD
ncbi:agmatine deiminase family protein [Pyruvatibacter sp.]|uniref:agmatine deiminase family protein n=1 Tax=Pyruvatibacter sp. TaxID=1981328 RepID=UPI00326798CA